jgi:hypothetical protein
VLVPAAKGAALCAPVSISSPAANPASCPPAGRAPQYNTNVDAGQNVAMIDSLFTGNTLGHKTDIADGSLRGWEFRTFDNLQGDYYIAPRYLEKVAVSCGSGRGLTGVRPGFDRGLTRAEGAFWGPGEGLAHARQLHGKWQLSGLTPPPEKQCLPRGPAYPRPSLPRPASPSHPPPRSTWRRTTWWTWAPWTPACGCPSSWGFGALRAAARRSSWSWPSRSWVRGQGWGDG